MKHAWLLPLAVLAILVVWASLLPATTGSVRVTDGTALIKSVSTPTASPGLRLSYDESSSRWTWAYGQVMKSGCEKLLLHESPVNVYQDGTVTIEMRSYESDDMCALPPRVWEMRGGLATESSAKFKVFVDGELRASYPAL
jgi:hypothetical protein